MTIQNKEQYSSVKYWQRHMTVLSRRLLRDENLPAQFGAQTAGMLQGMVFNMQEAMKEYKQAIKKKDDEKNNNAQP